MSGTEANWRRLAAAIVKRAVLDARSGNGAAAEARRWLASDPRAGCLLDAMDISQERVTAWVSELPPVAQSALPL
jgi:hypothetical protein